MGRDFVALAAKIADEFSVNLGAFQGHGRHQGSVAGPFITWHRVTLSTWETVDHATGY
jgi:hypothetical protein